MVTGTYKTWSGLDCSGTLLSTDDLNSWYASRIYIDFTKATKKMQVVVNALQANDFKQSDVQLTEAVNGTYVLNVNYYTNCGAGMYGHCSSVTVTIAGW